MCAQRLWPTVQALGRGLVSGRSEIIQQGVKAYNAQNFNPNHLNQGHSSHDRFPLSQRIIHTSRGSFSKVVTRSVHSGTVLLVKDFADTENEHAHAVMRSLPAYHATTVGAREETSGSSFRHHYPYPPMCSEWAKCSADEIANRFIATSQECRYQPMDLEDTRHSELCSELVGRLTQLNDNQLLKVLSALSLWPPTSATTTPNFVALWNALDKTCTERINRWDITHMFLVADHWYALRLSRITMYNIQMTKLLGRKVSSMGPTQLVQYLFYANLSRKLQPFIIQKDIEKRMSAVLSQISIEELGVIAMGFFKTQTFLKDGRLIEAIAKKTQENLECVSDASLCAILKLLRKSTPVTQWKLLHDLLESLIPQLDRLNNMCLLQVALLGNDLLVYHPQAINIIATKFASEIETIRLKDIERITFALMLYNCVPVSRPDIFSLIAEELRKPERTMEINHYPKCFVSCVVYLTTLGLFPQDLISAALQPSMLNLLSLSRNYSDMGREVNELEWSLVIEGPPNYQGYRLNPELREQFTKEYLGSLPVGPAKGLTHQQRLLIEVKEKLAAMLGGLEFLTITHVLPHVQAPDLVFCTNSAGHPVVLPREYRDFAPTALKPPLGRPGEFKWNAVIVAGRNAFIRNTEELRGNVHMKRRQLTTLGYYVSVIPFMEYNRKGLRAKLNCLDQALRDGSSLSLDGCVDAAWLSLKARMDNNRQEEVVG